MRERGVMNLQRWRYEQELGPHGVSFHRSSGKLVAVKPKCKERKEMMRDILVRYMSKEEHVEHSNNVKKDNVQISPYYCHRYSELLGKIESHSLIEIMAPMGTSKRKVPGTWQKRSEMRYPNFPTGEGTPWYNNNQTQNRYAAVKC
jgi:hypothetical protein